MTGKVKNLGLGVDGGIIGLNWAQVEEGFRFSLKKVLNASYALIENPNLDKNFAFLSASFSTLCV